MKVGSLVFTSNQGLSFLAKAFYDHAIITDVVILAHGRRSDHPEWYPKGTPMIYSLRAPDQIQLLRDFCKTMDVMLFFETPFEWSIIDYCKSIRVKTVLMPMYECMPKVLPAIPDLFLNPSELDQQYYQGGIYIPVPVEVPWRRRTKAEVFVHNAGNGGLKGRNGTLEVMDAIRYCDSPAKFLIRSQGESGEVQHNPSPSRCDIRVGTLPFADLWADGDVFLFPEKFNGLSLPLQEARAAGMLVMCADRFPMNKWLPTEPLIPVHSYERSCVSGRCNDFQEAIIHSKDIARKVSEWYGRDIECYSEEGRDYADRMSWDRLAPRYLEALESL